MTLKELESMDKDFLTVDEVSRFLHCSPQLIRDQAEREPKYLGFPISKIGHSYRIPREGFLRWFRGQN